MVGTLQPLVVKNCFEVIALIGTGGVKSLGTSARHLVEFPLPNICDFSSHPEKLHSLKMQRKVTAIRAVELKLGHASWEPLLSWLF